MNFHYSAFARALAAIVAGVIFVSYPEKIANTVTMIIGLAFLLSGIVSIIIFYMNRRNLKENEAKGITNTADRRSRLVMSALPVVGVGSCILGGIMLFAPTAFNEGLAYVFAAAIIFGAVSQMVFLVQGGATIKRNYLYWILPILLLLFGMLAIISPETLTSTPYLFFGIAMIVYGVSEVVNALRLRAIRKQLDSLNITDDIEEAEVIE